MDFITLSMASSLEMGLGIVPESFVFNFDPVWIKLGRILVELLTKLGLAVGKCYWQAIDYGFGY